MFLKTLSLWGIIWFLSSHSAKASELKTTSCTVNSYQELIRCAEKQSKEILLSEQQVQTANKLEEKARAWINPELQAESLWKGSEQSETTATLLFTWQLGGKRTALINEAKNEKEKVQSLRDILLQQKRLEIMLSLYKLSHLKIEVDLEEESIETFKKVVTQFEKKALRTPEQDVSLSIFKMAVSDHQLKLSHLKSQTDEIFQNLEATTGFSKTIISKFLPNKKENWPEISEKSQLESAPQMRSALADLKLAKSLKEKADSEAYPDIKIGPTMRNTKDLNTTNNYIGISLSLPLPAFSRNSGARAYQEQKVEEATIALELVKQKELANRSALVKRYQQTVQSLKTSLNMKTLMEKHELIEKQFFKGLVSSTLVIEAHRQLYDLQERQNSSELEALESYGQILILDNAFYEVIL